jgi:hypothetical protein
MKAYTPLGCTVYFYSFLSAAVSRVMLASAGSDCGGGVYMDGSGGLVAYLKVCRGVFC